jgi:hypothetical protein
MELVQHETETIDRLFLELSQFTRARTKDEMNYDTLIYAIQRKFPNESRFETALRYIMSAENNSQDGASKTVEGAARPLTATGAPFVKADTQS